VLSANLCLHFHAANGLHPRYLGDGLARLLVDAGFVTIRLSFETAASEYETAIDHKVNLADLTNAIDALERAGFPRKEIEVYVISALPKQTPQQTLQDLLLVHGLGVKLNLAQFSPIPGTTAWQDAVTLGMEPDIDLIYTNNSIFARQWGEEYYQTQVKLQLLARVLNYAIDLNLPLSGTNSLIRKMGLEKNWFSE